MMKIHNQIQIVNHLTKNNEQEKVNQIIKTELKNQQKIKKTAMVQKKLNLQKRKFRR